MNVMNGVLVLVVGPPGAGKDTLLDGARRALEGDKRLRFARRAIDQPRDRRSQSHEALDPAMFAARRAAGAYAFIWRSAGVQYGVPADIAIDLEAGRSVVVNLNRGMVAEAASRFPVRVVEITAPPELRARRLAAKGRGDAVDAAGRLSRPFRVPPGLLQETVVNDGSIEQGVKRLTAALIRAVSAVSTV
jgi:ribose 1,5-bisphosphokinase